MADYSVQVTMPDFSQLSSEQLMRVLHDHAGEIGEIIESNIEDRTPVRTGALKEDETFIRGSGKLLVRWFVGDAYQDAEYHKVYSLFQEGPPLGAHSDPRGQGAGWPHQMYYRVATDDLPIIAEWAQNVVDSAASEMADAAQAGAENWSMP